MLGLMRMLITRKEMQMYKDQLINDVQDLLNEYTGDKITHAIFIQTLQNIVEYELAATEEGADNV